MFLKLSRILASFLLLITIFSCSDQEGKYEFVFYENGGSEVSGFWIKEENFVLEDMPVPTRLGYTFEGWYLDEEFTTPLTKEALEIKHEYLVNLYAKWELKTVTITFVTGGADAIDPISGYVGNEYTLPSLEWTDHTFDGWYIDEALTTRYVSDGLIPNDDLTLYAKWFGMTYTINFDTMGGPYIDSLSLPAGSPLELPTPVREGFVFVGWYDASLLVPFTETIMPDENLILYAKWAFET
jgi:uncharacterized repeat protein (TIGR02543 family)